MSADDGFSRPGAGQPHYRDFRWHELLRGLSKVKEGTSCVAIGFFKTSRRDLSPSGGISLGGPRE
jgi:hypothetical protein